VNRPAGRLRRRAVNRLAGRLAVTLAVAGVLLALAATAAAAHPLGNFSVNRYYGLVVSPGELRVDHVQDLAEIPAAQARSGIDTDGDGRPSAAELAGWARRACGRSAAELLISLDRRPIPAVARSATARLRPGQAGLPTLRLECAIVADLASRSRLPVWGGCLAAGGGAHGPGRHGRLGAGLVRCSEPACRAGDMTGSLAHRTGRQPSGAAAPLGSRGGNRGTARHSGHAHLDAQMIDRVAYHAALTVHPQLSTRLPGHTRRSPR
jgi:hypothetical protein